jgi:hypothetical protein
MLEMDFIDQRGSIKKLWSRTGQDLGMRILDPNPAKSFGSERIQSPNTAWKRRKEENDEV